MKIFFLVIAFVVGCNSYIPLDVEKSFIENEIVPDVIKTAPKKIINVSSCASDF